MHFIEISMKKQPKSRWANLERSPYYYASDQARDVNKAKLAEYTSRKSMISAVKTRVDSSKKLGFNQERSSRQSTTGNRYWHALNIPKITHELGDSPEYRSRDVHWLTDTRRRPQFDSIA